MFLICCTLHQNKVDCIFLFIENHPVLVSIITSVTVSSLWLRKFIMQKRAEAFFGFYAKLSLRLRALETMLQERGQLNISNVEAGNIFSLIYLEDFILKVCPSYKEPDGKELALYKTVATELKKILLETENNVYPPGSKQKEWYESQHIIFSFCEFLENDTYWHITNEAFINDEDEAKHIIKCESLINAMDYIQKSIENAKY